VGHDASKEPGLDAEARRFPSDVPYNHHRTIFAVAASLVGVCITAIGLVLVVDKDSQARSVSRGVLAFDSLVFLIAAAASYHSMRAFVRGRPMPLASVADGAVLLGLFGLVVVCVVLVSTLL
jgi:hypothetical protein